MRGFASFESHGLWPRFNFLYFLGNFWRLAGESLFTLLLLFALGFQWSLQLLTVLDSCSYSLHLLSNTMFELHTWEGAMCGDSDWEAALHRGAGGLCSS